MPALRGWTRRSTPTTVWRRAATPTTSPPSVPRWSRRSLRAGTWPGRLSRIRGSGAVAISIESAIGERIAEFEALDALAGKLQAAVGRLVPPGSLQKDLLSGRWLGH